MKFYYSIRAELLWEYFFIKNINYKNNNFKFHSQSHQKLIRPRVYCVLRVELVKEDDYRAEQEHRLNLNSSGTMVVMKLIYLE